MSTPRLAIVPLALALGSFFVISYVLCVLYGLFGFQQGMHRFLFELIPGFTWITWPGFFIGLVWSFLLGWYVAIIFVPLFNFFRARAESRATAVLVFGALAAMGMSLWAWTGAAIAAEQSKTGEGLTVYLGVVPAEIVKGLPASSVEPRMHGGVPHGSREHHVVVVVFDAATGARISGAAVTAQVSGTGLSGSVRKLEPMQIEGTASYGGYFKLVGRDLYTVKLVVTRPNGGPPAAFEFKYDRR